MATTLLDLITDSLSEIGQLGIGQSASAEMSAQALRIYNRMTQKWSLQRLLQFWINTRVYTLTPGTQNYDLGPTAVLFPDTRPVFVETALAVIPGTVVENTMNVLDKPAWGAIRDKGATCSASGVPQDCWPEYSFPNIILHFWMIPSAAVTVKLGTWETLQQCATIFDLISLPPGYEAAIQHNLAMELCPLYDMPVSPALSQLAADGLIELQKINAQGLGGSFGESQNLTEPTLGNPQGTPPTPAQASQ